MNSTTATGKSSFSEKEEKMLKSYNEEFYTSLKSLKFLNQQLPQNEKLFYHFEQNENASVSTTTGQLLSTYDELYATNEAIKKNIKSLSEEIKQLEIQCDQVNGDLTEEFAPEIERLSQALTKFINEQRIENYKLMKEISLLEKEKAEIQQSIYNALGYMHRLEKEVGIKSKTYTYIYDQTICENELSSKFVLVFEYI